MRGYPVTLSLPASKTLIRTRVAKCDGKGCNYMSTCWAMAVQHETTCSSLPTSFSINTGRKSKVPPSRQCSLSTCENQAFQTPSQKVRGTLPLPLCPYHIYCAYFRLQSFRDGKWMLQNPGNPDEWIQWPYPSGFNPQLSRTPNTLPSWMAIDPSYATTHGRGKFLQAAECVDGTRGNKKAGGFYYKSNARSSESEVTVTYSHQCSDECEKVPRPRMSRLMWGSVGVVVRGEGDGQCDGVLIDYFCVTHALKRGREMVDENNDIANVSTSFFSLVLLL